MRRCNHRKVQCAQLHEGTLNQLRIGPKNVRKIFACFIKKLAIINIIIEALAGRIMLSKGIVREQNAVISTVGRHAVRPMQHSHRSKGQRALANIQRCAVLHHLKIEDITIMLNSFIFALHRDIKLRLRASLRQGRHSTGMVRLHVIDNDTFNAFQRRNLADVAQQLLGKRSLYGINQRNFFVHNQIRIIGRTTLRFIAVEITYRPILYTYIINIFNNLQWLHNNPP